MLSLGLLGNEINAFAWRLKAKIYYVEGAARVEKTEIIPREGAYELEVTYHLEIGGREYRSATWLDRDDPSSPTRDSAEARPARIEVGRIYPCWYWPDNPEGYNELTPAGLQLYRPIKRLWIPLTAMAIAWMCCRWTWKRCAARGVWPTSKAAGSQASRS
jgi:hypothetical protein